MLFIPKNYNNPALRIFLPGMLGRRFKLKLLPCPRTSSFLSYISGEYSKHSPTPRLLAAFLPVTAPEGWDTTRHSWKPCRLCLFGNAGFCGSLPHSDQVSQIEVVRPSKSHMTVPKQKSKLKSLSDLDAEFHPQPDKLWWYTHSWERLLTQKNNFVTETHSLGIFSQLLLSEIFFHQLLGRRNQNDDKHQPS